MTGPNKTTMHTCPNCSAQNAPRGKALTVALTCKSCGLYFCPHTGEKDKFIETYQAALTIGSKATIDGKGYELLGYTLKKEKKYRYKWTEYFLFSPYHGIAFLSEYDGNWNFLVPYPNHPLALSKGQEDPEAMGMRFLLYSKYKAEVLFAKGEFFSDIIGVTERSQHMEHIAPPYVLVMERSNKMVGSYLGKYISRDDVASAFKISKEKLPPKKGMGYTQPILGNFTPSALIALTVVGIGIALLISLLMNSNAAEENIMQTTYTREELKDSTRMFSTPSFKLENTKSLVVNVTAPLDNDWFFAEYSLINDDTDQEYVFDNEVEYYFGVDQGETWSEGSKTAELFLSSVPPGKYHFDIYPEFSPKNGMFRIAVFRDATFYGNFWVVSIGLLIFPALYFSYRHYKEVKRWSDSDYSPYSSE